jgi:hypothetical protein
MAAETELFYLVLFVALALIIHVILSNKGRRGDRRSHSWFKGGGNLLIYVWRNQRSKFRIGEL